MSDLSQTCQTTPTCQASAAPPSRTAGLTRRSLLGKLGATFAGLLAAPAAKAAKTVVQKAFVSTGAPKGYDPTKHKWVMAIDVNRCLGCGLCAEACKKENHVPEGH